MTIKTDRQAEALHQRYQKYAIKFVLDSQPDEEPTDANLSRVLGNCVRPAHAEEYAAIRTHVDTYRTAQASDARKRAILNAAADAVDEALNGNGDLIRAAEHLAGCVRDYPL